MCSFFYLSKKTRAELEKEVEMLTTKNEHSTSRIQVGHFFAVYFQTIMENVKQKVITLIKSGELSQENGKKVLQIYANAVKKGKRVSIEQIVQPIMSMFKKEINNTINTNHNHYLRCFCYLLGENTFIYNIM